MAFKILEINTFYVNIWVDHQNTTGVRSNVLWMLIYCLCKHVFSWLSTHCPAVTKRDNNYCIVLIMLHISSCHACTFTLIIANTFNWNILYICSFKSKLCQQMFKCVELLVCLASLHDQLWMEFYTICNWQVLTVLKGISCCNVFGHC